MASRFDNIQTPDPFDEVTKKIEDAFDKLVQLVHSRKISLLTKLSDYRIEFDNLVASRIQTEKELHSMKQQIENVTANELKSMQDKFLSEIEEKLHKLTLSTTSFELDFQINSHIIEQGISKLAVGKRGRRRDELDGPRSIAYEEESGLIFICDMGNALVKIFNSAGEFVSDFGSKELYKPWGILLHGSYIYVTDVRNCSILKYERSNYQLLKRVGNKSSTINEYKYPRQLAKGPDGYLYYAPEDRNNRISVLDTDLILIRYIQHERVVNPVAVKFTKDNMFVLSNESTDRVHLFNMDREYIECIISLEAEKITWFFTIDIIGNILISNYTNGIILVYNSLGVLLHSVGKQGDNKGEFDNLTGICTTRSGRLIIASSNENYGLQIF
ncbi:hypothetical protein LOD99_15261 [Oopsacas minuta]|uniref:Uncharacterized protein n=1 Tax=Oopsacas minuta TaxID=111878 RepID=A0AAV7KAK7_9METZ|nr:hypothetical protein LOD99_15261 [Oopsacas minuta]